MYSARTPAEGAYRLGTSGLLYRSNKLMYDRQTYTLWSNLTGEPVLGRLASSSVRLEMRPVSLTTWADWRRRHPDTTVVKLHDGHGARWGFDYRPGRADRRRAGVSFPVWLASRALPPKEEVFGLVVGAHAKAYPVERIVKEGIVNDQVGGDTVLLVADPGGAVRAYRRSPHRFRASKIQNSIQDDSGRVWRLEEEALVPEGGQREGILPLPRLPGHVAFWFAWFAFHPKTEVYGVSSQGVGVNPPPFLSWRGPAAPPDPPGVGVNPPP